MSEARRLYLLDTNVLMHDPTALFRFEEHDIFLPMVVLEELDAAKKGMTEVARNVRQVSRFIGEMMNGGHDLDDGLPLIMPEGLNIGIGSGRLYFQTGSDEAEGAVSLQAKADNEILRAAMHLSQRHPDRDVVLVSKDINLRIKAAIHGIPAEDYHNDRALDDLGAESALFVGDSESDVVAAHRAGLDSAFIRRSHCADATLSTAPDYEVENLYDVAKIAR